MIQTKRIDVVYLKKVQFRRKIENIDTTTERVIVCVTCMQLVWVENKKNQNFKLN